MFHYLFTNDLRISNLESFLIEAGKCFVENKVPSAYEDKNANNNMNTLGFYFNLTEESNCAKLCSNGKIRPVVLNFIKKFQFPNPRTTESLNEAINDGILIAPLRIIIQSLYFMNMINKDEAYLTDKEIADYIFFNDNVAKKANPDILSLSKEIIEKRKDGIEGVIENDELLEAKGFYWKQCKRQIREMVKVLTWAGCAERDSNGNIRIHHNNLSTENKAEIFEILSYSEYWTPDSSKNANYNKKSYQKYMDIDEVNNYLTSSDNVNTSEEYILLFKKFLEENIEDISSNPKNIQKVKEISEFNKEYPLENIKSLDIEDYVLGNNNKNTLSYKLEFGKYKKTGAGIGGSTARKFGVYKKNDGKYFGKSGLIENIDEFWARFKESLYTFLKSVEQDEMTSKTSEKYPELQGMSMVLTKLCFLYYPTKFIAICSKNKLALLLKIFGVEYKESESAEQLSFKLNKFVRERIPEVNDYEPQYIGIALWKFIENIIYNEKEEEEMEEENERPYTKDDFLNEVYMDKNEYEELKDLLLFKKNIILEGAPGVGKTFMAKRLAYSIIGVSNKEQIKEQVMSIQFHQSYSYEEFIEGIMPSVDGGFIQKDGIFKEFCNRASENPNKKYFFIIDEINRGNISKIFGELMVLIENDKRGQEMVLTYSNEYFKVPENVYIIGMMNTADKSLALMDYALRRRFDFYPVLPAFENPNFIEYIKSFKSKSFENIIEVVKKLNEAICKDEALGSGFMIGHSYFCNLQFYIGDINIKLKQIIKYSIIPLIKEYWYDDESNKVELWEKELYGAINE